MVLNPVRLLVLDTAPKEVVIHHALHLALYLFQLCSILSFGPFLERLQIVPRCTVAGQHVFENALGNEEHLHLSRLRTEELLPGDEGQLTDGSIAKSTHRVRFQMTIDEEERVLVQHGSEGLHPQLHAHAQGEKIKHRNLVLLRPHFDRVLDHSQMQIMPHTIYQLTGDAMLVQVATQNLLLLQLPCVDGAQVCHGLGDAADKGREGDERKEQNADRIHSFNTIFRCYLHRCRCKLRQRPVQAGGIAVPKVVPASQMDVIPSLVIIISIEVLKAVPATSDEMVDNDDEAHKIPDAEHRPHVLRTNALHEVRKNSMHFHDTQQSQDSHTTGHCLANSHIASLLTEAH
mmetsp:Transcript_9653/g.17644  ORF Transcript_9653/g.17644 Transcript_9653/m.17644 type:complete len:346 (-) Transcript_9653:147-1184(-)